MNPLIWDDLRILLAVSREGTLRAAARKVGLSPATAARRLDSLEGAFGEKLVERMPTGCIATGAGEQIIAWAAQMEEIAFEIERLKDLRGTHGPEGVVRINTEEWISYLLATRLSNIRHRHPRLSIEILTSHDSYSLVRREADIVLRNSRPEGGDLIARRIGTLKFGLYGSVDYVRAHRHAIDAKRWKDLSFVGFDDLRAKRETESWLRALEGAPEAWLRASYALGIYDGVASGAGLGVLTCFAARANPSFVAVREPIDELEQEVWMTTHAALRGSARIRAVSNYVADLFRTSPDLK